MAACHHRHGAAWVHVRPLRPPHAPGETGPSPTLRTFLSRAPIIGRRSPASSSFVLAAARLRALQLDPGHTAAATAATGKGPNKRQPQAR
jgi:hypothetical protein